MSEITGQDNHHPAWINAWNAKAAEIDEQIISHFHDAAEHTTESLDGLVHNLHQWWERQHMDAEARADYERVRANADILKERLDERMKHLIAEGRLALGNQARKVAGQP
jgi:hypothetical protein